MTLTEAAQNIGKTVNYRPYEGCPKEQIERGRIKSTNESYVFVEYFGGVSTSRGIATKPDSLTLEVTT